MCLCSRAALPNQLSGPTHARAELGSSKVIDRKVLSHSPEIYKHRLYINITSKRLSHFGREWHILDPFRTAAPFWGQTIPEDHS